MKIKKFTLIDKFLIFLDARIVCQRRDSILCEDVEFILLQSVMALQKEGLVQET